MSDRNAEWLELRKLLPSTLNLPGTEVDPSSYWTHEEIGRAIRASVLRHVRAGWRWKDGELKKGTITGRPSALMGCKTPADRDYNPAKDALALRMGAELITRGPWLGYYRKGDLLMRHDGTLVDPDGCPECGGQPWMVRLPTEWGDRSMPPWSQRFTYCRRCVTAEELADLRERRFAFEDAQRAIKARKEARRR